MKNKIRALIVDDERLARRELKTLLSKYPMIEIVGEAENVSEAIVEVNENSPDVLFLDIQMPGQSGFDLLEKIEYSGKIIFVTAFDEYAIRAFNVNALDYLLKPISPERLSKTIQRIASNEDDIKTISGKLNLNDRLFVSVLRSYKFITLSKVIIIQALAEYTKLIIDGSPDGILLRSMKEWEEKLPENHFIRVHRSFIVNINYIEKIGKSERNSYCIYLKKWKETIDVSRRNRKKVMRKLNSLSN